MLNLFKIIALIFLVIISPVAYCEIGIDYHLPEEVIKETKVEVAKSKDKLTCLYKEIILMSNLINSNLTLYKAGDIVNVKNSFVYRYAGHSKKGVLATINKNPTVILWEKLTDEGLLKCGKIEKAKERLVKIKIEADNIISFINNISKGKVYFMNNWYSLDDYIFHFTTGESNFKTGSEPDGFRGAKWLTHINELTNLNLTTKWPHCYKSITAPFFSNIEGRKCYYARNINPIFGRTKINNNQYIFINQKLAGVVLSLSDTFAAQSLLKIKFGEKRQESDSGLEWMGDKTLIIYLNDSSQFMIYSSVMYNYYNYLIKKEAISNKIIDEKGADTDF